MKLLTIIGARPQFIKAAIFSEEIKKHPEIDEIITHTGQHYDKNMSEIFFEQLQIPKPKYNLDINQGNHGEQTGRMMIELEKIVLEENPEMIVVYGDTNSTLAGALVGSKLHIPVAHIEAGFRSQDKNMPEELNRICTDHVSSLLFCPTQEAVKELRKEGIEKNVYFVGDIMYDAAKHFVQEASEEIIKKLGLHEKSFIFCTIHRPSNTDSQEHLENIFDALVESNKTIVLPLHPRTKKKMQEWNLLRKYEGKNIQFIEPTNYLETLQLIVHSEKVITDSGGVLREAYFFKKPCIILRENIEFKEAIENEEAVLVGARKEDIQNAIHSFQPKGEFKEFFGDGTACKKIIGIMKEKE